MEYGRLELNFVKIQHDVIQSLGTFLKILQAFIICNTPLNITALEILQAPY